MKIDRKQYPPQRQPAKCPIERIPGGIDTLAAAYAEVGNFEQATKYEQQPLNDPSLGSERRKEWEERLHFYQLRKPYESDWMAVSNGCRRVSTAVNESRVQILCRLTGKIIAKKEPATYRSAFLHLRPQDSGESCGLSMFFSLTSLSLRLRDQSRANRLRSRSRQARECRA